jgi:signal transduction histidine kinase
MAFSGFGAGRTRVVLCALLMAGAAAAAVATVGSPRWQVLAGLIGVAAAAIGWRALAVQALPAAAAAPEFAADGAVLGRRLALLDSQLEQLPVALWTQPLGGAVVAANARARRLVAPGGAVDAAVLLAQLAASGERGLLSVQAERGQERWLLSAATLSLGGAETRLLAMLPVESALESETLHAWRQLTHVLTHEIMNSLTPIASLARTAQSLLNDPDAADTADDLALALETVARRAESLASFVGNYRKVSELPAPQLAPVALAGLFARLEKLVAAAWQARGGAARFQVEPASLCLMADAGQLEQALLNLLKNAAEATADIAQPSVSVQARLVRGGRLVLEVRDNGPGVPPGLERDIFLPFFSARVAASTQGAADAREARGIGLAVVRSLVHGMGGTVRCVKSVRGGAAFVLSF